MRRNAPAEKKELRRYCGRIGRQKSWRLPGLGSFRGFMRRLLLPGSQDRCNDSRQLLGIYRLHEMKVKAGLFRADVVDFGSVSTQHDESRLRHPDVFAQAAR